MKEVTMCCTTCPGSCALKVIIDEKNQVASVAGNGCPKGEQFAHKEWVNPERMLTSTVYAQINGKETLIPVKTKDTISKKLMKKAMEEIQEIYLDHGVVMGEVIQENLAGSGVALVACKTKL